MRQGQRPDRRTLCLRPGRGIQLVLVGGRIGGRHAEHVPVDRPVAGERHGRHQLDLVVGETIETPGEDHLERGPGMIAGRRGQGQQLGAPGVAGRNRLAVTVVVGRRL